MATSVIGALSVEITVDAKGVKDGIKASGEALSIGGKQLRKGANEWGKWAVAAVAAVTAVTAAIVKTNLDNIKELKASAAAADETVAAFQRGAFAAEQFGVSQEKYGDILKDVNDRVGDFLITGAGPMVDFFDSIGPKVNVTADSFKNLSGSQSLGLYIESLQKAGASQQEMTFFMEALAGDATRLIPLFQDNAKAFNALTFEAKALGIGLSDIDVQKAEMASQSIAKSLAITEAFGQELTVSLAPIIGKVIDLFEEMAVNAGGAGQFIDNAISGVIDVVGVFADGLHGVSVIFKTLEVAALGFSSLAVNVFSTVTNIIATSVDGWIMIVNEAVNAINDVFDTGIKPIPAFSEDNEFIDGVNAVADNMISLVAQTNAELHSLATQELPSDQIKSFADAAIAEFERVAIAKVAITNDAKETSDNENSLAGGDTEEVIREREKTAAIVEELRNRTEQEQEVLFGPDGKYAKEAEMINAWEAEKTGREAAANQARAALDKKVTDSKIQAASSMFGALASIMSVGGKKTEKIQKALAITSAGINGYESAVAAWKAGMSVGGPAAPAFAAAYAGASLVKTAGLIAGIKSGGKGSSGGGGGGIPSVGSGGAAASSGGGSSSNTPESRQISINMSGGGLMSTDQVRELIGQINESVGDGVQLITSGE
jgi:hypothetical protein